MTLRACDSLRAPFVARPRGLWDALGTSGDNILLVKASYWLSLR